MANETGGASAIRNYLLGGLPESEAEEIERLYFADRQRVDEVWAVFGELAEEHLSGALSGSESRRFEERLRSTPALREMFEREKALFDYAARIAAGTPRQAESGGSITDAGWRGRPRATFFKRAQLAIAGVLALIALFTWFALRTRESANSVSPEAPRQTTAHDPKSPDAIPQPSAGPQRAPQPEPVAPATPATNDKLAEENNSLKAAPDQRKSAVGTNQGKVRPGITATFLLSGARVREGQNDPILEIPAQTVIVQLELELPNDDCGVFSAVLQTESNKTLQRWDKLRALYDHSIPRVVFRIPADSLKNASYVVNLDCVSRHTPPGSAEQFRFKVEKKRTV